MDVAFWHHTKIIDEMSFFVSNLAYLVIGSHRSVLAVSFVVVLATQVFVYFFEQLAFVSSHNYTITTVYNL